MRRQAIWWSRIDKIFSPQGPRWQMLERASALGGEVDETLWAESCESLGEVHVLQSWLLQEGFAERTEQGWVWTHRLLARSLEQFARQEGRWADHCRCCATALDARLNITAQGVAHEAHQHLARLWMGCGEDRKALDAFIWAVLLGQNPWS